MRHLQFARRPRRLQSARRPRVDAMYITDGNAVYANHDFSHRDDSHLADASAGHASMDPTVIGSTRTSLGRLRSEAGTTMIETAVACGLLLVTLAGLMTMGAVATMHTENQGHLAPRTTEYAQDKMEQLLGLAYGDIATDTVVFPAARSRRLWTGRRRQLEHRGAGQQVRRLAGQRRRPARRRHGAAGRLVLRARLAGVVRRGGMYRQSANGHQADHGHGHRPFVGRWLHAREVRRSWR